MSTVTNVLYNLIIILALSKVKGICVYKGGIYSICDGDCDELERCTVPKKVTSEDYARDSRVHSVLRWEDADVTDIDEKWFAGSNRFKTIVFIHNGIKVLNRSKFLNVRSAANIYLQNNKIEQIESDVFDNSKYLTLLYLQYNSISNLVPLGSLLRLKELHLSYNKIAVVSNSMLFAYPNLEKLYLDYNQIESVNYCSFCNLTNLKVLDLSNNRLTVLSPNFNKGLTSIISIQLNNNRIKEVHNTIFTEIESRLQILNFDDNYITDVHPHSFKTLINLQTLILSHNIIRHIAEGTFKKLRFLETLFIHYNLMTCFTGTSMAELNALPFLVTIRINDNPWRCSCFHDMSRKFGMKLPVNRNGTTHIVYLKSLECLPPL